MKLEAAFFRQNMRKHAVSSTYGILGGYPMETKEPQENRVFHIIRKISILVFVAIQLGALASLPTMALATEEGLDYPFSPGFTSISLTKAQKAILGQGTVQFNQSVTQYGYTVTLESGISDGFRILLVFRVDAPKGTTLDANQCELLLETDTVLPEDSLKGGGASYCKGHPLMDEDPNDNSIRFLKELGFLPSEVEPFPSTNGHTWSVRVTGIQASGNTIPTEGVWEFSVQFPENSLAANTRELLSVPVKCSAKRFFRDHGYSIQVKVTSVQLRALSATMEVKRPFLGYWDGIKLEDPIFFVMNDGTKVKASFQACVNHGQNMSFFYSLEYPIPIREVVHIEFPDICGQGK